MSDNMQAIELLRAVANLLVSIEQNSFENIRESLKQIKLLTHKIEEIVYKNDMEKINMYE